MPASSLPRRLRPRAAGLLGAAALAGAVLTGCSGGSDPAPDAGGTSSSSSASSSSAPAPSSSSAPAPSSSSAPGGDTATPVVLQATETDFAIDVAETELEAGTYTIEVTNEGQASHDLVVEGPDGEDVAATEILPPGGTGSVEVTLEPGEYVFYCSVGNHRGMGMELPVTVA